VTGDKPVPRAGGANGVRVDEGTPFGTAPSVGRETGAAAAPCSIDKHESETATKADV